MRQSSSAVLWVSGLLAIVSLSASCSTDDTPEDEAADAAEWAYIENERLADPLVLTTILGSLPQVRDRRDGSCINERDEYEPSYSDAVLRDLSVELRDVEEAEQRLYSAAAADGWGVASPQNSGIVVMTKPVEGKGNAVLKFMVDPVPGTPTDPGLLLIRIEARPTTECRPAS